MTFCHRHGCRPVSFRSVLLDAICRTTPLALIFIGGVAMLGLGLLAVLVVRMFDGVTL